jgi:hypothetical protein
MATTTNYNWSTPDDTALVKDGASAIRSLGTAIDTTTKNLNPSTTLGDIEYRSSTANTNTRLAIGSNGNVLTVSGGVPAWVAPAGGGKVLQVVQGTLATAASTTSASFVDTGLTATITPSSASSKILVIVNHIAWMNANASRADAYFRVLRDATSISGSRNMPYLDTPDNVIDLAVGFNYSILDNPATTSATTYKTQYQRGLSGVSISVAMDNTTDTIILMEIGA